MIKDDTNLTCIFVEKYITKLIKNGKTCHILSSYNWHIHAFSFSKDTFQEEWPFREDSREPIESDA